MRCVPGGMEGEWRGNGGVKTKNAGKNTFFCLLLAYIKKKQ
jgi:hypothetical protein